MTGPVTQYTYDQFNRLTSTVNGSSTLYTYSYDRWGNRWAQQGAFTFSQAFNTTNNQLTGYAYDAAGNLMSDGTNSYAYDADGNVIQGSSGGNITTMIYDALNHQVGQGFTSGSDIGSAVAFDKGGNLASLWLISTGNSLGSSPLIGKAYWNGTAFETYNSSTAFFEHRDWVGSRRAATNSAGTVTDVRTSLPFGDGASNVSGSRDNTFDGYTGLWDASNATNHAQFRDYWNVAGRWLQPDPYYASYDLSNPQSFNRYAYVLNNPVTFTDPSGECAVITAGINQGPNTASGQALLAIAAAYGANVAFPYAGEDPSASVENLAGAGAGFNQGATDIASQALQATAADATANGSTFFALGFSGGAQANISAGVASDGQFAFYDPGLGLGQSLPKGSNVFRGVGAVSDIVNATSPGGNSSTIAACGHDLSCAIANGPALQKALANAGPCKKPTVFVRSLFLGGPLLYVPIGSFLGGSLESLLYLSSDDNASVTTSQSDSYQGQPVPPPPPTN